MNYLAHFHLSYGDDELLIGGLLGDFVKGPLKAERSPGIEQGIMLHRKIDAFTDSHPALRLVHQRFEPRFRRFAGIMTDVLFDHFLNRHWGQFHPQPLADFSLEIFALLKATPLPAPARLMADNLARYDVFRQYQHWPTVESALTRIGQRIKRDNPLHQSAEQLQQHYPALEQCFLDFYPQLQQHARQLRSDFEPQ